MVYEDRIIAGVAGPSQNPEKTERDTQADRTPLPVKGGFYNPVTNCHCEADHKLWILNSYFSFLLPKRLSFG